MKLRIDQKELADAARRAFRRLPTNPLQPVLAGLLIEAAAETVTLSGFDLETATRAVLDADTLEPGEAVVSGRLLADVTGALPAGPIDVVADERELTVTAPGNAFTLPLMIRGEYPALPVAPGAAGTVDGDAFAEAIVHAAQCAKPAAEATGSLEALGGVHVAASGDKLTVSASDRYRIVRHIIGWQPDAEGTGELVLPAAEFAATAKQLADSTVRLAFPGFGGGVAALSSERQTVIGRAIATPFPNIDKLFPAPDSAAGSVTADAAELVAAVRRAALVIDDKNPIELTFGAGKTVVRGGNAGQHGSSELDADTDIDDFAICFNPDYLASLLAPIDGLARIWLYAATKPVLIQPVDDPTYRAVCMPVRLT